MTGHFESEDWRSFDLGHPGGETTTRWLLEKSGLKPQSKVLDLCCGAGDSLKVFQDAGFEVLGADRARVLEHARTKYPELEEKNLCPWEGGERIPFPDKTFDAVLSECSLSLFEGDKKVNIQNEISRVLKEEGLLLLSDITKEMPVTLSGFDLLVWQDGSEHIKPFIARWIWMTERKYPQSCKWDRYFLGIYRKKGVDHGF